MRRFFWVVAIALCVLSFGSFTAVAQTDLRISISPPNDDLSEAIGASSLLATAHREKVTDPQELIASARADYARILAILYEAGRFGGTISIQADGKEVSEIQPLAAPKKINQIRVLIDTGPVYRFAQARVAPLTPSTELPESFQSGAPGSTTAIRDAAAEAITDWRQAGFGKAEIINQRIVARHDTRTIDADLTVSTGPKLSFGSITISGNKNVRTRRIDTIAGLEEGDEFDPEEIARAERRLRRTGSFQSVTIDEAEDIGPGDTLPLHISVAEQIPRRFGFGAEVSNVEGLQLTGFWMHRNLLGGAERFRVEGEVSGIGGETGGTDYHLDLRYERPATPRPDVDLFATLSFGKDDEPDYISKSGEFELGFTRYATDELVVEFGLGYLYSRVEDAFGAETYRLAQLPLRATLDRRDNALNPSKGVFFDVTAVPFYGIEGSDSGAQFKLDARGYRTFREDRPLTAALRLQFGSLVGPDLLDSPPFYRFYSGGGGTVRGQDYQSLSVDVGGGNTSGGRSFAGLSAELRAALTDAISVVGFYDYGYVGAESFPDGSGSSHSGAGVGLRYNTGIGPIRLDIARPLTGDADASNFYIYVGIGQAF
ncbi:MAG: autotransporter assembly complex protein TamA [Boseongicola sp.]|nr:autotransporter assembly complex protein TamA [Boseongicola sp.]MDD9979709.1 autotransporter assembly complex protein TamA [Boseongicola sp.]